MDVGVFVVKTDIDEVTPVSNYFGRALGNALIPIMTGVEAIVAMKQVYNFALSKDVSNDDLFRWSFTRSS